MRKSQKTEEQLSSRDVNKATLHRALYALGAVCIHL